MSAVEMPYRMSKGQVTIGPGQRQKAAPAGAGTPNRGLADRKDNDRLMASVPCPADPPSTCTEPHVDGCGECVYNYEEPHTREPIPGGGCQTHYRCTDCGHEWTTAWWCGR